MRPQERQRRLPLPRSDAPVLALLLALVAVFLTAAGWVSRLDFMVFDAAQRLMPPAASHDVVIVAIDSESLEAIGSWPWLRSTDAALLQAICRQRPAAVGLDMAFTERGSDTAGNVALAKAIRACGDRVALPVLIENRRSGGPPLEALPMPPLSESAAALGRVGVEPGADGIVRRIWLWEGVGEPVWPLMAQRLLALAGLPAPGATPQEAPATELSHPYALVGRDPRLLRFLGPPGTVPRLSAGSLLSGDAPADALTGRIVLVGATAVGLGDQYAVPFDRPMPGVELQANLVEGLHNDTLVHPLSQPLVLLLSALLAALPMLWLPRLMPLSGMLLSGAWVVVVAATSAALTLWPGCWFPAGGTLVAALAAYPLWSWRRLEAARRYLDRELQSLGDDAAPAPRRSLSFEQRLSSLQAAQARLRDLQTRRDEALAFISHDLRGPLAAAVQRLEDGPPDPEGRERLLRQLRRALRLTQTFVSLSRAQAMNRTRFVDLDLSGLLDQAADTVLEAARQAGVRLARALPARPVWVRGDFEVVERMADNLLRNAVQHAPRNSAISLQLDVGPDWAEFSVTDRGPGLSPELRERLFSPYARGQAGGRPRSGSTGLGLHFVQVAAGKLGGRAGVDPPSADGTRFWVRLPRLPDDSVGPATAPPPGS